MKNHILHSAGPKLENLIPLETSFKVIKVPRRQFSKILNGKHSNFSSKWLICTTRQFQSWFSANFENSGKLIESELASEIHKTVRVPIKVLNTTNGARIGVLSVKI